MAPRYLIQTVAILAAATLAAMLLLVALSGCSTAPRGDDIVIPVPPIVRY
jgi:hypothetical protein